MPQLVPVARVTGQSELQLTIEVNPQWSRERMGDSESKGCYYALATWLGLSWHNIVVSILLDVCPMPTN